MTSTRVVTPCTLPITACLRSLAFGKLSIQGTAEHGQAAATRSIAGLQPAACCESQTAQHDSFNVTLRQGSEAEGRAAADAPLLAEDFAAVGELLDQHPDVPREGFTLKNYMAAASWLASRGFGVDDVHGAAHCSALLHLTRSYWQLPRMLWWCMFRRGLIPDGCRFTKFAGRAARRKWEPWTPVAMLMIGVRCCRLLAGAAG
jgi:hypothetical protein